MDKVVKSGLSPVSVVFNGSSTSTVNVNSTRPCGILQKALLSYVSKPSFMIKVFLNILINLITVDM